MKIYQTLLVILGFALVGCATSSDKSAAEPASSTMGDGEPGVVLNNLLASKLEGVEGTEVVVSHVTIPPNTSLPKHWHPGEEFAYVLEGTVTLWQKDEPDLFGRKGDVLKVPLKKVHTAITGDEGVTLLVFRVHEQGEPERNPAK